MAVVTRRLVVTADDFGLSPAVNRGVETAHRCGIVTSTSLMVRRPHAADAARRARHLPGLSLGLHLELADYDVVDDEWVVSGQFVDPADGEAVRREVADQVSAFVALVGRSPSHLDSHHHLHLEAPVDRVVSEVAAELGVPVRARGPWSYRGDFYGQYGRGHAWPEGITTQALRALIGSIGTGTTEVACHPADGTDPAHGVYDRERPVELAVLCDAAVLDEVGRRGIELVGSDQVQPNRPET